MGYTIKDIPELGIVEVIVVGLLDTELRQEILSKSSIHLIKTKYERLMIDITDAFSSLNQSMTEAMYLTSFMKTIGFHDAHRVAFIYYNADNLRIYLESTAMVHGFKIQYFKERKKAITWLCQ